MSVAILASRIGEIQRVEYDADLGRIYIFIGDDCITLDTADAIDLRDRLADALTQASIHRDAQESAA